MRGNYREMSYAEEAAKDGSIFSAWTRTWGLHIRPWYDKDKLKFSFVEVGQKGKGKSFDIYMDIIKYGFPCFKKWANDIKSPSRRFERILAAEAEAGEKYPKAYKYVTGEKGNKTIGICNSTNGSYCINASIMTDKGTVYANIPVDFGDLELIVDAFNQGYAGRLVELEEYRFEKSEELAKYYEDHDNVSDKAVIADQFEVPAESIQTAEPAEEFPAEDSLQNTAEESEVKMTVSVGYPEKEDGEMVFNGTDKGTGKDVSLYVKNETMLGEQKEKWSLLAAVLKEGRRTVTFIVEPGEKIFIKKIA